MAARPPRNDPRLARRGSRLVEAMHRRGIFKQHALAHQLGVNESTITRWKRNETISVEHAVAVCDALSITLDWFLCGLGPMERPTSYDEDWRRLFAPGDGFEEACGAVWRHEAALVVFADLQRGGGREHGLARRARHNHRLHN